MRCSLLALLLCSALLGCALASTDAGLNGEGEGELFEKSCKGGAREGSESVNSGLLTDGRPGSQCCFRGPDLPMA